ncbi:MAG TPA: hypothetical protein VJU86_00375 [Pyrinomonadaceae bacterium]|nr:hypothetical protein [Pyrinomonadaceae bacterium]
MSEHTFNGWTFRIRDDTGKPVPWVYENVKNYGNNFATEISIEKIIVEVEEDGKVTPRSLKFSDFEAVFSEEPAGFLKYDLKTRGYSISVANFSVYQGNGMLLDLVTKKGVLPGKDAEGKPADEPLYLFFTTLFGDYGNDPPHEFTGALQAARFTPAIRFETMNPSVQSIRVHYRFHFDLDSYLQDAPALTKLAAEARKQMWGIENYASLIRDADHFPPSVLPTMNFLKDVFGLQAEMKFFDSVLEACKFEGSCRFQTSRLDLEISHAIALANNILNISFRDPRTSLTNASQALKKTSVSLVDEKIGALSVASSAEYDPTAVDKLSAKIFEAIVGPAKPAPGLDTFGGEIGVVFGGDPLPGISAACLKSNIKYCLIQLVIRNYPRLRAARMAKQLRWVREKMSTDLADILKYLEPGEFEEVLEDIESLVKAMSLASVPIVGPILILSKIVALAERIQKLAGKIISIASFDAAEKPVLYEVIGTYVEEGKVTETWDNLHWWGTEEIPSAPGAFFAVHSHYRWTQLNTYPSAEESNLLDPANAFFGTGQKLQSGAPQFRSLVKKFAANKLSGPLIDPDIAIQTISFALALNGGGLDQKLKASDKPFEELSADQKGIPTVSEVETSGKNIVYWLSCKAVRTQKDIFKGTLLVNGFYFGHDEEKPFSLFRPANLFAPTQGVDLQKPKREKPYHLFRSPSKHR